MITHYDTSYPCALDPHLCYLGFAITCSGLVFVFFVLLLVHCYCYMFAWTSLVSVPPLLSIVNYPLFGAGAGGEVFPFVVSVYLGLAFIWYFYSLV